MEKEISGIVMLGIVLMAVAVLIGLGFNIFSTAKSTANDGVTKVQTNLANIAASEFADYDQTVVTGTQVKSAYQNFVGKNVAILIATQAVTDQAKGVAANLAAGSGIKNNATYAARFIEGEAGTVSVLKTIRSGRADATDFVSVKPSSGTSAYTAIYVNYNALLNSDNRLTGAATTDTIYLNEGKVICQLGFLTDSASQVVSNNTIANLSKSGMIEYLSPTSRFNSNLIVDSTNTTIGIVFTQLNTN